MRLQHIRAVFVATAFLLAVVPVASLVRTTGSAAPLPPQKQQPASTLQLNALKPVNSDQSALRLKGGEEHAAQSSWLRQVKEALFPVHRTEAVKFFSMSFMMFFIIYIYTTVRDTKDTLVVSTCGAEAITFLKVYGVLPAATGFMVYYSMISSFLSKKTLFYVTATPFLAFYALFAWVLYPNRDLIHPKMPSYIDDKSPWKYPAKLICNWSFSLFYIISELWGSVGVSVLFWQFANDIIPVIQAKRFYPLFGQLANIAPICAGLTVTYFAGMTTKGDDAFGVALQYTTVLIVAAGICLLMLYHFITVVNIRETENAPRLQFAEPPVAKEGEAAPATDTPLKVGVAVQTVKDKRPATVSRVNWDTTCTIQFDDDKDVLPRAMDDVPVSSVMAVYKEKSKKKKAKLGMAESFKFLVQQKYLGFLCILVVSYGLSINLTEVIWKSMIKKQYPDKKDYQIFMGKYSSYVGAATFIIIFFGSNIVKHLGWTVGALTTPVLMGVLAAPFFALVLTSDLSHTVGSEASAGIKFAVFVGMIQNIFSKAIKYALFDPTKEMAYIPLDQDSKVKGKAAIDVLAARIGKSGGALVQQAIVLIFGTIEGGAHCVAGIFFATIALWTWGVLQLSILFNAKLEEKKRGEAKQGAAAAAQ